MPQVKCYWCKQKDEKSLMMVEEKPTGKFNKNGTEKMKRKFFHKSCAEEIEKDKVFKQKEAKEFDDLYELSLIHI